MLNFLSSSELNFKKHWKNGLEKLSKLNNHDKFFTYAWILGHLFIYLKETQQIFGSQVFLYFLLLDALKK